MTDEESVWAVNGGLENGFFRIDAVESRVGVEFLLNPVALARTFRLAERIVSLHNTELARKK